MLLIVGTVRLPGHRVADARPAMPRMIEASRAEEGCIGYSYAEDVIEVGLIHVKELWTDQEALDRHFDSTHIAEWRAAWAELEISNRDLRIYAVGEGRPT